MICGDCIHKEVCGLEGYFNDNLITCKYKVELPHNTGHWIKEIDFGNYAHYICSECGEEDISFNYCSNCGAKMIKEGD